MAAFPKLPTKILAPNGKPAGYFLYSTPRYNPKAYRPRHSLSNDTRQNVSSYDRWELVDYSRQLVAQVDILATAIEQKNNWSFGDAWEPHYMGPEDAKSLRWSDEANDFLVNQFFPFCNVRGPEFDLRTSMKLMGEAWDRDGDDLMILTETESHFPQLAFFPATRIGTFGGFKSRPRNTAEVDRGRFEGLKIFDGIIQNANGRRVAVRILNDDGTHSDIDSFNGDLAFEPKWCDQVRGIPRVAVSLLRWLDLQDIDEFLQAGVKRASTFSLKIMTAEGEAAIGNEVHTEEDSPAVEDTNNTIVDGTTGRKVHREEIPGGGYLYYLDSTQGEDIKEIPYSNPHPNVEAFIERLQRGCLNAVGWYREFLNLNEGGRATTRLLADLANQTLWDRQATGMKRWRRIVTYALAKAAKHGFISRPPDPRDFGRWEPGLPKQISVDAGNDAQAAREGVKMGMTTKGIEASKAGYHHDAIRRGRFKETQQSIEDALAHYARVKDYGVSFQTCMEWVEQRSPNPVNQVQPAAQDQTEK